MKLMKEDLEENIELEDNYKNKFNSENSINKILYKDDSKRRGYLRWWINRKKFEK